MGVKALYYNCLDIGKRVKKSKRRFTWKFSIDGREHMVDLVISYLSGKKKITHNGKLLYEGQKIITSSFQFPFEIDLNMCNVVQQGEMYELRINNQAFSQLYGGGGRGGDSGYEGESRSGYSSKGGYEPASRSRDDYDTGKSSYGGYGSGGSKSGYGASTRTNDSSNYNRPSGSGSYGRAGGAWEDVRQAEKGVRKDVPPSKAPNFKEESDTGFASEFDKFDYKGGSNRNEDAFESRQNKPSYNRAQTGGAPAKTAFDDFQVEQPKKSGGGFTDFSDFGGFGGNTSQPQKPSTQSTSNNAFTGFDNFGGFNKPQNSSPLQKQEIQRSQTTPVNNMDILGLDFSQSVTVSQPQNTQANTQNAGFDFFGQSAPTQNQGFGQPAPTQNQGFGQPAPTNVSQTKAPTANDLLGLDFGAPVAQQQQPVDNTANQGGFDFLGGDQPTQPVTQTQPQTQAKPQPAKSDLWSSDLVSLSSTEVDNTKNKNPYGNQSYDMYGGNQSYNTGYGGGMNNYGGMGGGMNMNTGTGMNMGMNAGFGGNMNTNASNFGGMNKPAGQGNFGGQSGFGGQGGFGGQSNFGGMNSVGMNAGFGGNSTQSMGGNFNQGMGGNMQGNMGYSNTQQNNFGMGGGFQQQPTNQASTGADLTTPFDF